MIDWDKCEGVVCNGPVKCGTGILLKLAAMMGFEQRPGLWLQNGREILSKNPKHEDRPVGVLGPKEFMHSHLHPVPA